MLENPTFNAAGRDINNNYQYTFQDEKDKYKKWLDAPDCSTNFRTALNKKVVGTGQWILVHPSYLYWKEKGSILWIHGTAGSGKTFLLIYSGFGIS
ncbi:hypothetical protein FB446DRAFT_771634 [Lentinula raphanica]|nr:hypothetical protein FB446DRAFT_771634 [Lentinula raphanica]